MRYLGSKLRLAKHIVPIIQGYIDNTGFECYIEPFIGGANVIDKVICKNRVAIDANPHLIAMWQALQKGWEPPEVCTREEYMAAKEGLKKNPDMPGSPYLGFIGIACAFSGSWFAGYSESGTRNRCAESKRAVLKQVEHLKDVNFICEDCRITYKVTGSKAVIYLDPPYAGIDLYPGAKQKISTEQFWDWAKDLADGGNIVLVSEYQAPDKPYIDCLWQQEVSVHAHQTSTKKRVEKLFLVKEKNNETDNHTQR